MESKEILQFIKENFGAGVFSTVEEDGNPRSRYAIIQHVTDNDGVIFQTTKDKRFYRNLQNHPVVSFSGMVDGPKAVSFTGKVRELGEEGLNKLIEAKPEMAEKYQETEARQNAAVFEIYDAEGQYLNLGAGESSEFKF